MSSATPGGHSESPLKKIIIGVTTTVLGAAIIYFFSIFGKDDVAFEARKKATNEAWESLQTYEKSFKNAGTNMVCSGNETQMTKNLINEYENIIGSITNIKNEKKESADNRIISLIDRRLSTLKDKKEATMAFYKNLDELENSDSPQHKKDSLSIVIQNQFAEEVAALEVRDTIFMNDISADLKKKYKTDFKFSPPFLVTPEAVTGNWTLNREIQVLIKKDNTFEWNEGVNKYSGKWELDGLNLNFDFSDGDKNHYTITGGNKTVILMRLNSDNSFNYICRN